ncbi:FAD-dependent oxidoreductase [Maricaulis sp.]|uniref:NAD(P)/FAD-dependent oxidoreductase n=1 Tax=Maricaulis sp. TaxID=1486257 RepID=UPI001B163C1F|nr:FAD-dependent oxidoreductase [Maricaulis sp.]MBO6795554.1 FAD-dependent oxidoreductase [Maricaulis sp.]
MDTKTGRKIAVIGSGISGLSAAWQLSRNHEVDLFEGADRLGGHAHTRTVDIAGQSVEVDTGFIVYNPRNYPNFTALLKQLNVQTAESDMSFAASLGNGRFEYSSNPGGLFAQKRNFLRPRMWRMLFDLVRLYRQSKHFDLTSDARTIDEFLREEGYSDTFRNDHILPMCAAIWSSPSEQMKHYPARTFFRFFINHGLLQLTDRPAWRTIQDGSQNYVRALHADFAGRTHLGNGIRSVERTPNGVLVHDACGNSKLFDEVVLATHSDQALSLLQNPSRRDVDILDRIRYRPNTAILHTDTRLMPRKRAAWASWNYLETSHGPSARTEISLTYWMNALQPLKTDTPVLVTLNPQQDIRSDKVLAIDEYDHPLFDSAAITAQQDLPDIQGEGGVWYAGAWMGSGFHEDGLQAGLAVAEAIGAPVRPWGLEGATNRIHWADHLHHRARAQHVMAAE